MISDLVYRLRALFRRKSLEAGLEEELRAHVEHQVEKYVASGLPRADATRRAHLEFGGLDQVKEECRDARGVNFVENLFQDLRYGARILGKKLAFTALTVVTLALGIGANTAIFSIVDAVLLRRLAYRDPDRLVVIWGAQIGQVGSSKVFNSYRDFEAWQHSSHSFDQLEALTWAFAGQTLSWRGKPQRVLAIPATQGIFPLLGVQAAAGRTFGVDDLKAGCSVVLSHHFWQDRLGSPADAVGETLTLDGRNCTVIGIMPSRFEFYPRESDLWTLITPSSDFTLHPRNSLVGVFGRLRPGVSRATAQAELTVIHQRTVEELPAESWITQVVPVVYDLRSEFTWLAGRNLRNGLLILSAAVALVLLIACVNVANLTLGRAREREKEIAIRSALGSGRARLVRQLLTESFLLSALGTGLGVFLAAASVRYFRATNPVELPPGSAVTVNLRVLGFSAFLAVLTGVVFGLFPAWKASRLDPNEALKEASRGALRDLSSHRAAKLLVVFEAALSVVLLAGAGLLIKSMVHLGNVPLGFTPNHLLTAEVSLPKSTYPDAPRQADFFGKLASSLGELPGVKGVALSSWLPLGGGPGQALTVEGRPTPHTEVGDVEVNSVSQDFFRVMGIPLFQGREFDSRDRKESQPVAIVNEAWVKEYFPDEDPIGRQIKLGNPAGAEKAGWITIIGVVGNVKQTIVYQEMSYVVPPAAYRPVDQAGGDSTGLIIRTTSNPLSLRPAVEHAVSDLDKDVPVSDFRTAEERIAEFLSQPRFRTVLLGIFAAIALVLAAVGIYGVLSQFVSQRRHEIGIRMALGAERSGVIRLVAGQGMALGLTGVAAGLAGTLVLTRFLSSMLYGVKATDPVTLAGVAALLLGVALHATFPPGARRRSTPRRRCDTNDWHFSIAD